MKFSVYQDAVEELVDKQTKHADDDIGDMQEEGDIHDDRFVPSCERALVSHEAHQEDDLIQQLREKARQLSRLRVEETPAVWAMQRACYSILIKSIENV